MGNGLPLRMELGIRHTADGLTLFRGQVERGPAVLAHTEWVEHAARAIGEGHDLLRVIRVHEEFRDEYAEAA